SIEENLEMGGLLLGSGRRNRVHEMLERFPILAEKRRLRARTLSGGQRQILAMARALMTRPQLLLLDEPSAGLAPNLVADMFATIRGISREGTAVLMVEQNAKQALAYADRGYVLENGRVRFEGPAPELLARGDIGELYLGVKGG
ncbi:MAG TPA: ATP-binding cassette domain-containing protein, partial [Trueperaceae bacterium]